MRRFNPSSILFGGCLFAALASDPYSAQAAEERTGKQIYKELCVQCHGDRGQGVPEEYEDPLIGDASVEQLTKKIHRSMPEETPEQCEDEDAAKVAQYIYDAFYSPEAQARNHDARIEFSRLTVRQYENAVADLIGSFQGGFHAVGNERGLDGEYYNSRRFRRDHLSFNRVDAEIDFQFGEGGADPEQRTAEEFAIRWRGSVIAEETGDYEFIVKTENGFRLWVNSHDDPLIDGWVASGGKVEEHRETIRLLEGRAYPIRIDLFKYKDKTASVNLRWKPPHGVEETLPERNLTPDTVPPTMVVTTPFPPDDSSVGYPRGTSVSKAWDRATTYAAIEVANYVTDHLEDLSGARESDDNRAKELKAFCRKFAERAFRRPLSDDQQQFFVEAQFQNTDLLETAVKRSVLLVLKSPRFLYPELGDPELDSYDVASRLSFGLWDSLPDRELFRAAEQGELLSPSQVTHQARRMLRDPRAKSKLRSFFHHWLKMDEGGEITKDDRLFPGFDQALVADLRASLNLFIDQIVRNEDADYQDLLLSDFIFMNERLAGFYNAKTSGARGFEKVAFEPEQRSGVITHPYLLAHFAYRDNTSPIHRGVFLTRNVLGRTLHPPPEAVEFDDSEFDPDMTMREKVAELTKADSCQNCHSVINPLGFSLEHFDAVGRFRTQEKNAKPIDATAKYPANEGPVDLQGARDLAAFVAENDGAQEGFVIQLFNLIAKQPVQAYGDDTLDQLHRSFRDSGYNIHNLVLEIAKVSALHPSSQEETAPAKTLAEASNRNHSPAATP